MPENRPNPGLLSDYRWTLPLPTRWRDNDIYGHMNNVVYYALFDTVANQFLITEGEFDFQNAASVGFVVNSHCNYHAPVAFPETLTGALRISRIGKRSLTYQIGIFSERRDAAAAEGDFTHVFVNRQSGQSSAIPDSIAAAAYKFSI